MAIQRRKNRERERERQTDRHEDSRGNRCVWVFEPREAKWTRKKKEDKINVALNVFGFFLAPHDFIFQVQMQQDRGCLFIGGLEKCMFDVGVDDVWWEEEGKREGEKTDQETHRREKERQPGRRKEMSEETAHAMHTIKTTGKEGGLIIRKKR